LINLKQELQNYPYINLTSASECDVTSNDNIKNSVILYNKSLESLRQGSEDIAIIELKKAVSLNPHFHEAMNLLGICYSYINEHDKASEMFERVMAAENNSVKAIRYMSLLNSNDVLNKNIEEKGKAKKKKEDSKKENSSKGLKSISNVLHDNFKSNVLKYVMGFLIGISLTVLTILLLNSSLIKDIGAAAASTDSTNGGSSNSLITRLQTENTRLEDEIKMTEKAYKNTESLFEVEKLARSNKYEQAAKMLIPMKEIKFTGIEKDEFIWLYNKVMPLASKDCYGQGIQLMISGKYAQAVKKLGEAELYGAGFSGMDKVLYNLGKSYYALKDKKNAIDTYKRIVKNYPKSPYYVYASNWLKVIK